MASAELKTVVKMLRANQAAGAGSTLAEQRAGMEAGADATPLPDDVQLEPVDAGGVPGEWARVPGVDETRALLYLHGGGYVMGSVRTHRALVAGLARAAGVPVLSLDYRVGPEHPFPAAVHDGVAGWRHLLASGRDPARMAIAGDSAGGGLAVAVGVKLRDAGDPLPGAIASLSGWLDLDLSGDTWETLADVDPLLSREGLSAMREAYLAGASPRDPLASPLYAELAGLPPLLLQVGTAETLLDDSRELARRAREAGVDVTLEPWQDMFHDWQMFAAMLPEGQQAIDAVGQYLRKRLGG